MSLTTFQEIELKFRVASSTKVPDLASLPGVGAVSDAREHNLSATYYDTEDLRLQQARITLRRRTGGKDDGWHLKFPGDYDRLEVTVDASGLDDATTHLPRELLEQVRSFTRTQPLVPVALIDTHRTEVMVLSDKGEELLEFCDDRVTARSLLPGGQHSQWREWEIELAGPTSGTKEGRKLMKKAAALLRSAGAETAALPSKLVAALGDGIGKVPVAPFAQEPEVKKGSAAAGVVAALAANRDKLLGLDARVRRDEEDSVHAMRVATRELRSHLATFAGVLAGPEIKHLRDELKVLAQVLGRARDAEVVEERFLHLVDSDDSGVLSQATRDRLRTHMGKAYERAHRQVVAALDSPRYLALLDALDEVIARPPLATAESVEDGPRDGEQVLLANLDEAYQQLVEKHRLAVDKWQQEDLPMLEREEYFHDMRKAAKKLRYSAEAVGAATKVKTKRLYRACRDIQESLGDFQDAVTSRDRLVKLASAARRRGEDTFDYGVLYQREHAASRQALAGYHDAVNKIVAAYERQRKKYA